MNPALLASIFTLITILLTHPHLTPAAAVDPAAPASPSIELTPATFTPTVFQKPTLVKFYAPWCGHCRALAPIWDDAARLIARTQPNLQLAAVDCTQHGDLCSKFAVRGYPTIKYIRPADTDADLIAAAAAAGGGGGLVRRVYGYGGARTALGFEQFVSQEAQWKAVAAEDYPLPLPDTPVPLQLASLDQRKQAQVAAEDAPPAAAAAAAAAAKPAAGSLVPPADSLKAAAKQAAAAAVKGVKGAAGGGLLGAAVGAAGGGSGLWYGEWMNVALGVAVLLIAVIGYWLYTTTRSSQRSSKAV